MTTALEAPHLFPENLAIIFTVFFDRQDIQAKLQLFAYLTVMKEMTEKTVSTIGD